MKKDKMKLVIPVAKFLLFVMLFMAIFGYTGDVLRNKKNSEALAVVARQPEESYDVILAGPSHIQYALQPAQLFGEYGIVSCNVGTSAQSIPTTYYVVKEMIEKHSPELVVVDLFCLFWPEANLSSTRFHQAIDHLPLSVNKIEAINALAEEEKSEFFIDYLLYHGRWKSLKKADYTVYSQTNETYQIRSGLEAFPEPFVPVDTSEMAEIPEVPLQYLEMIVDLCKETGTELLLTVIPYRADVDNNNTSAVLQQQMYNTVAAYAKEWGVDYLNGLHFLEEMGFDFNTDLLEYSHVNVSGAEKVSAFYGEYLTEHYDLPDRSGDPDYAQWHEDYAEYLTDVEKMLSKSKTLEE